MGRNDTYKALPFDLWPFWARLRDARKRKGHTQEDAALSFGIDVTSIARWENAHSLPAGKTRRRLAELYIQTAPGTPGEDKKPRGLDTGAPIPGTEAQAEPNAAPRTLDMKNGSRLIFKRTEGATPYQSATLWTPTTPAPGLGLGRDVIAEPIL